MLNEYRLLHFIQPTRAVALFLTQDSHYKGSTHSHLTLATIRGRVEGGGCVACARPRLHRLRLPDLRSQIRSSVDAWGHLRRTLAKRGRQARYVRLRPVYTVYVYETSNDVGKARFRRRPRRRADVPTEAGTTSIIHFLRVDSASVYETRGIPGEMGFRRRRQCRHGEMHALLVDRGLPAVNIVCVYGTPNTQ